MRALAIALTMSVAAATARADVPARLAVRLDEHPGAQVPLGLRFEATDGSSVTLNEAVGRGRPAVLVLAYARCTMLCSLVLRGVGQAVHDSALAPGRDFDLVVVSIDPRETREEAVQKRARLLASIGGRGDPSAVRWLRGSPDAVAALADALGFHYAWDERTQQYAHPAVVFVLNPDGRIAEYVRGVTYPGAMLDDAIARARSGAVTTSAARDLVECFHFDPALAKYGRRIHTFFQLGALTVMLVLFGAVVALFVWERRRARR